MPRTLEADVEMDDQDLVLDSYEDALLEVRDMLAAMKANLSKKVATSADYCRLIQMQIDLQQRVTARNIKEIKATWLDPESPEEQ